MQEMFLTLFCIFLILLSICQYKYVCVSVCLLGFFLDFFAYLHSFINNFQLPLAFSLFNMQADGFVSCVTFRTIIKGSSNNNWHNNLAAIFILFSFVAHARQAKRLNKI